MTRVLIAGGGTAGHLVPGLSVAAALVEAGVPADEIHFVGSDRGVEAEMVPAAGYGLDEIPSRGLERKISLGAIKAGFGLLGAARRGISVVGRRQPGVVVSLGGHAALPGVVGAVVRRRPLVLMEQNVKAGAVNKLLSRFAKASAVSFPGTDLRRARVTGNPLRADLVAAAEERRGPDGAATRDRARRELGLPVDRTVVLVTTGSLGSGRVNEAVRALADRWADRDDVAIRHVTGRRDHEAMAASAPAPGAALHYDIVAYEDRMPVAMAAADVAVTRAGASTCTELAAFGVPAIMVPLPIATRDHQTANATVLADAGGAVVVPDPALDVDRLEAELTPLVADTARRAEMATAMAGEGRLDAAARAAELILEVER
ncbi:MAG TPA: UDP-N-acetylglucosamine--N-acetylmuramyl-(pentapeptide) pyrophosphoryl-undecaprenol N-acetylglucosamine transferase [Iamia sp.]